MGIYEQRPWLPLYDDGMPQDIEPEYDSGLDMFRAAVGRAGDSALIHYFDSTLTLRDADELSDALAVGLLELGLQRGDRVGVYLQNVPQFVLTMLAVWKAGGVMVSVNPMLKGRELEYILNDSGTSILVALESLHRDVAADVGPKTKVQTVITTSELDFLDGAVPALLGDVQRVRADGTEDLVELSRRHQGRRPEAVTLTPDDVAFLTYTSGTTGTPKGAMNTHRNVVF